MQKLSRTGAYAGWCLAIALVGVIFISLVHDVDAGNNPAGDGEPAHWVAVNTARGAVEAHLNSASTQVHADDATREGILNQLQNAWTAYQTALHEAQRQDGLQDLLARKAHHEQELAHIERDIAMLSPSE